MAELDQHFNNTDETNPQTSTANIAPHDDDHDDDRLRVVGVVGISMADAEDGRRLFP